VSGEYDASIHRADGNGIVVDLMGDAPATLIAENVVYQNGGRGIHVFRSSNVWVINNTVYQNVLDDAGDWGGWSCCRRHQGNINILGIKDEPVRNVHLVNNLVTNWKPNPQSVNVFVAYATVTDQATMRGKNVYVDPPLSDPNRTDNYRRAVSPLDLGDRLVTRPGSGAVDAGIQPSRAAGLNAVQAAQLTRLLGADARGAARPQGRGWDVGAYEVG
jgi:parallel beta-helix repeat protein